MVSEVVVLFNADRSSVFFALLHVAEIIVLDVARSLIGFTPHTTLLIVAEVVVSAHSTLKSV